MEYSPKKLSDILEKHGFNFKKISGRTLLWMKILLIPLYIKQQ